MAGIDFKSVDEYIAAQPEKVQNILKQLRSTIRKAVPGAEETISYKSPRTNCAMDRCSTLPLGRGTIRSTLLPVASLRRSGMSLRHTRSARGQYGSRSLSQFL